MQPRGAHGGDPRTPRASRPATPEDLTHVGIFRGYHYTVADLIASSAPVPVLAKFDWSGPPLGATYLSNRFVPPKVQVFLDFARTVLADRISPCRGAGTTADARRAGDRVRAAGAARHARVRGRFAGSVHAGVAKRTARNSANARTLADRCRRLA